MRTLNNKIKIDRANSAAENISTGEEKMSNSSKKTPWFLRFAPGAMNLKSIAATAGIGTIYGLLFASLLFSPLMPHLEAQSSGTPPRTTSTAQLQDGAQVQWIWTKPITKLPWKDWLKWVAGVVIGGYGANAIYDKLNEEWTLPPGAASKGRIQSIASIGLWKMDGEKTHWYTKSGEWAWQSQWGFDNKNPLPNPTYPMPLYDLYNNINSDDYNSDYHYIDYSFTQMVWDEDNEIWKSDPDTHQRIYNTNGYDPDLVNTYRNNGEQGKYYPDHEDYKKGKKGASSGSETT